LVLLFNSFIHFFFFLFNAPATTEIYTLSLHDALPILMRTWRRGRHSRKGVWSSARWTFTKRIARSISTISGGKSRRKPRWSRSRSEEHTSELQSLAYLVCRLLLEKKKNKNTSEGHHIK